MKPGAYWLRVVYVNFQSSSVSPVINNGSSDDWTPERVAGRQWYIILHHRCVDSFWSPRPDSAPLVVDSAVSDIVSLRVWLEVTSLLISSIIILAICHAMSSCAFSFSFLFRENRLPDQQIFFCLNYLIVLYLWDKFPKKLRYNTTHMIIAYQSSERSERSKLKYTCTPC